LTKNKETSIYALYSYLYVYEGAQSRITLETGSAE